MFAFFKRQKGKFLFSAVSRLLVFVLSFSLVFGPSAAQAQTIASLNLPVPGAMVGPSQTFVPVLLKGMTIHPDNPLQFDFVINTGDTNLQGEELKAESEKLIKYFLASLTVPEEELWVNLSPYEKDRIVAKGFGDTTMGRDMLAQDYILKQLTASMMYPEKELGKKFWDRVYQKTQERFGSAEVPMNTFNKIWIVPDEAVVYQQGLSAFVIKSRLKVMLEEDYLALQKNLTGEVPASAQNAKADAKVVSGISSEIVREILVPEIEKEVNEGKTFANLRQIYNSLILATWYKTNLKESLLGQIYVNQNKTKGIDTQDKRANEKIYKQYVESFKKGVYNYIREDRDPVTKELIPRKYFSGGVNAVYDPTTKRWLSAIIGAGLLIGTLGSPVRADVADVLNNPRQFVMTTRLAEKKEEAAVITLQANAPELVTNGANVDLGNAVIEGIVRIDNRSGQPVDLGRKAAEFFPTTEDGAPIVKDAMITIVTTANEAQRLASSPITERGKNGSILRNLVFAVVLGSLACFGAACGKSGGDNSGTEQPGNGNQDQVIDMSTKTITQLREFLDDPLWENQRNAALEIYARFERQVNQETFWALERAKEKLVNPRIAKLTSEDPAVTTNSVEYQQLLELRPILKDPLKKWLENENADVNTRKWAEQLLEEIIDDILKQYEEILPSLRTVLQNPNSQIYDFAVGKVQSLIYRHPLALSTGIALLKDPVAGVRIAAANALADLGFESAIIPLGNARTLERDPKVITALDNATNALLQVTRMTSWSLEDLKTALTSPYWSIQKIAIQLVLDRGDPEEQALAVAKIQEQIAQLTSADDNTLNTSPYIHLLELGADAIAPLRANVENTAANIITREWSLDLLTKLLPYQDAFVLLKSILKDPAHPFYPFAINSLTRLILAQADPLALSTGIALLKDPLAGVRIAAANALEDIGLESAIIPLGNARSMEQDPKVIAALDSATNILLQSANMTSWSLEDLKAALTSPYWNIQKTAIHLVLRLGTQADQALAVAQIQQQIAQLTSPDVNTRNTSPYLHLLELGSDAIAPLRANVENTAANIVTRQWSLDLLTQLLSYQSVFPTLENILKDSTNPLYSFTIDGLTKLILTQTNPLALGLELLSSQVSGVRIAAIGALGQTKKVEAIAPLENIIATSANPAEVTAAKNALGILYHNVDLSQLDLTTWTRTALIAELDNSAFWVMQKRAAQELFRRNDAEGIALARMKLVSPRINALQSSWFDSPAYLELAELGYIIIDPLLTAIKDPNISWFTFHLGGVLLGTIGEFDHVANGFASVTIDNGYDEGDVREIDEGFQLLYQRQTSEFLISVLNDTNRMLGLRIMAAAHLGARQAVEAIDDLERQLAPATDPNFIATIHTALSRILAGMVTGTYDEVFGRLVNNVLIHPEYSIYQDGIEELKKLILANQWRDNVWGLMTHNVAGVRAGAARAMGEINDQRVFIPLKAALSDPEKLVRFYAAESLGKQEEAAYLADLIALRDRDPDPDIVLSAQKAITRISIANDLIPSLTNGQLIIGLDVDNWPTQTGAAQELFRRGDMAGTLLARDKLVWPLLNQLSPTTGGANHPLQQKIIQLGDITIEPLKEKAHFQRFTNTDAVKWAFLLLGAIGEFDDVFSTLLLPLVQPGYAEWHRAEAKNGLTFLISRQPQERLIGLLEHHLAEVRFRAALYLKERGDERASDALISRLPASGTAWDERREIAWALANIVETRAVGPVLTAFSTEPDIRTRDIMMLFLGNAGDPRANDVLDNALKTETDARLRLRAAESKRKIGDPAALPVLRERLTVERDGATLNAVQKAIDWITELDNSGVLDFRGDPTAVDELVAATTSPSAAVRYFATRELGNSRAEPAIATLENLRDTDTDAEVRFMADASLKKIYLAADVTQWSDSQLMAALDKAYWPIQEKTALELKRRNQTEGIALSLSKLLGPRMNRLTGYALRAIDGSDYQELKSLGSMIEQSLAGIIADTNANTNQRRWAILLKADIGEFDPTYSFLRSIINDTSGVFNPGAGETAQKALILLFKRQTVTAVTGYLDDASDVIQIAAAKALGAKGDPAALPALEAIAADTTESPEVINAVEAAIGQINAASSPIAATSSPVTDPAEAEKVGGIDFNPALLNLQIKRDRYGAPLPLPQQPVNNIHIDGLIPVIINITPVSNLPLLLGLTDAMPDGNTITNMDDPSKAREPEELSRLN